MKSNFSLPKEKCLILWLNNKEFHAIKSAMRGVNVAQVYKQAPTILRAIRRIQIELNIPFISFWISSWKRELKNYDTIITHASKITVPVVKYIKRKKPNMRIIVWYWNPVDKMVRESLYPDGICEKWSFDEMDCKKYGLNYNTQYYFDDIYLPNNKIEFDILFVGGDKGRIESLINIQESFKDLGISTYFHITETKKPIKKYKDIYKERISYEKILNYISKSRAILDYVSEKQTGLTIRPLEALFFKKKLITNDRLIINRDFYIKENIFVLGEEDYKDLPTFLQSEFKTIDQDIVNRYDFSNWIERFYI